MTEAPRPEVVRPPIDFSEFHREQTARRLGLLDPEVIRKEQEDERREREHDEACRRRKAEADAHLWALLPDNDEEEEEEQQAPEVVQKEDEEEMEQENEEDEEGEPVEQVAVEVAEEEEEEVEVPEEPLVRNELEIQMDFYRGISRHHLRLRKEILRSGIEDNLTREEFHALPRYDRIRIAFVQDHVWEPDRYYEHVMNFVWERIQHVRFIDILSGYRTLLEEYDPILGPDICYLAQFRGHPFLTLYERWCLLGY